MKTGNYQRFVEWSPEEIVTDRIIYLDAYRKPRYRRKTDRGNVIWNVLFIVLCLSVLVCLFLH